MKNTYMYSAHSCNRDVRACMSEVYPMLCTKRVRLEVRVYVFV